MPRPRDHRRSQATQHDASVEDGDDGIESGGGIFTIVAVVFIILGLVGAGLWWAPGGDSPVETSSASAAEEEAPNSAAGPDDQSEPEPEPIVEPPTVRNKPPKAVLKALRISDMPVRYQVSGLHSDDPDPDDSDVLTVTWDFDGGVSDENPTAPTVTFTEPGTYTITLTVTDPHGASDEATHIVEVQPSEIDPAIIEEWNSYQSGLRRYLVRGQFRWLAEVQAAFDEQEPTVTVVTAIDLEDFDGEDEFGLHFLGALRIDRSGTYEFQLKSNDGSRLTINDQVVIADLDGTHGSKTSIASIQLEAGIHSIFLEYFDKSRKHVLEFDWRAHSGQKWSPIPVELLGHLPDEPVESQESAASELPEGELGEPAAAEGEAIESDQETEGGLESVDPAEQIDSEPETTEPETTETAEAEPESPDTIEPVQSIESAPVGEPVQAP